MNAKCIWSTYMYTTERAGIETLCNARKACMNKVKSGANVDHWRSRRCWANPAFCVLCLSSFSLERGGLAGRLRLDPVCSPPSVLACGQPAEGPNASRKRRLEGGSGQRTQRQARGPSQLGGLLVSAACLVFLCSPTPRGRPAPFFLSPRTLVLFPLPVVAPHSIPPIAHSHTYTHNMVQSVQPQATTDLLPIIDLGLYLQNPDSAEAIAESKRVSRHGSLWTLPAFNRRTLITQHSFYTLGPLLGCRCYP